MNDNLFPGFLGRGWKFPPEFTRAQCGPLMSEAEQDIKESLHILLSTRMGERVLQATYGCNLIREVFESMNVTFLTMLKNHVRMSIERYEPRVDIIDVIMDTIGIYDGYIMIDVQYFIRAVNRRDNIVYPFYLNEGTNVAESSFPTNV
jgi:phage baseplate assembly protein W